MAIDAEYLKIKCIAAIFSATTATGFHTGNLEGHRKAAIPVKIVHERPSAKKLLVFSSADEEELNRIAKAYSLYFIKSNLGSFSNEYWESLTHTLSWKCYGMFDSLDKLQNIKQAISSPVRTNTNFEPTFTFIFTGQGAQWARMGVEIMEQRFKSPILTLSHPILGPG
ncbi:hypothetical protein SS1G_01221 [Sclerotinia sclerotiorum 1980 UF-70]|uniref:Malonyl-CoA:ACP transacylase (MAT) domain-containing protein n=1 Tax=Sclerotinia sclerotiorum (strain ATCC 18683 / 1980 / Ss-1) TaxID=665079 RepID=A7E7E3_SCLS1|nr:hypothetical protein SS1G_01221 [Sclerotinia sclerotiorum 1980 UF-70]EDN96295.1 hypothetical protein SS1G_01221 [Sclerotinia sclerotiorum 1980 UF-70]